MKNLNKQNAFTLMEIIGVVVIVGLILMIVFPSLSKLMISNNTKKFENYYMLIDEASRVYAATMKDELGPASQSGCTEFSLDDLITKNYLKSYDDKNTTCSLESSNIRVKNNKGKISTYFRLKCVDKTKKEGDYFQGSEDVANCIAYAKTSEDTLYQTVKASSLNVERVGSVVYVTNNPANSANKYIYYSGNLWQIVSYDEMQETIKVVSNTPVTSIPFSTINNNTYAGSTVQKWLESVYLPNLNNSDQHLVLADYDATPSSNFDVITPPVASKTFKSKIGLLSGYEARRIRQASGSTVINRWTLSEGASGYNMAYTLDTINLSQRVTSNYAIVLPTISFNSASQVIKGTGTLTDPYIIEEDYKAEVGDTISTRPLGEYIYLNYNGSNVKFRTTGFDANGNVKASYHVNTTYAYDTVHYNFSVSSLNQHLNTTEYNRFNAVTKNILVDGLFCEDDINASNMSSKENFYTSSCSDPSKIKEYKVGLYSLGDLYPTHSYSSKVWTMNPNTPIDDEIGSTINVLTNSFDIEAAPVTSPGITYNLVVTIKKDATVASGEGTLNSPYTVK